MGKLMIFTRFSLVLVLLLTFVQIFVGVIFANVGTAIREFEEKAATLDLENKLLTEQVVNSLSLTQISQKAKEIGLGESQIVYLTSQTPLSANIGR